MFAVTALQYVVELATNVWNDSDMASKALTLAKQIQQGIQDHAIVEHPLFGKIYAYEVDGLGNFLMTDDANLPSLLSIPHLGYPYDLEMYANSRRFILSPSNPTFHQGSNSLTGPIHGYGSPHMNAAIRNNI
jgi:meiotically up-regulated gene 157 (Mug157) protein